jgi:hypothetical protein
MRAARAVLAFLLVLLPVGAASAHVGSPHIYIEDTAGPYALTVACEMPPAVPGEATVQVLLEDRKSGEAVEVRVREIPPAGDDRAPEWVIAKPSAADPRFFSAPLPLMVYGLWHAEVSVSGPRGSGTIRFPVAARIPVPSAMDSALSITLALLTTVLLASLASILIGLGRDADRPTGDTASRESTRRGRVWAFIGSAIFLGFVGVIVYFWGTVHAARATRSGPSLIGQVQAVSGPPVAGSRSSLTLSVFDARHQPVRDVAPDHGKMMHLVIAKWPGASEFLHLHPTMPDEGVFAFSFTPPSAGRYVYFADVLLQSGEGDTVTGTIDVGPGATTHEPTLDDPDDSFAASPPMDASRAGNAVSDAGGGMTMAWVDGGPGLLRALELAKLTFELRDASGRPVERLDPYMGMAGHMLILRDDATMFAHVHPTGTVAGRMGAMPRGHLAMMTEPIDGARASFPYAFPKAGFYRVWIQMKYAGSIRTGVFDVKVP